MNQSGAAVRSQILVWTSILVLSVTGLLVTYILFVEAPPPRQIVIASGATDGAYFRYAQRYAELLKDSGVALKVLPTAGSVENLRLLNDENSDVMLALVQTGIADPEHSESLQSLCSLYREPLWIFSRGLESLDRLTQLKGKRVAVGADGSGTHAIAMQLLDANGLTADNVELRRLGGTASADALESEEIDAAFFVGAMDAPYIRRLLESPDIKLAELSHTEAYQRRFRFLSTVTLHAGQVDLQRNIPARDIELLAPAAMLVAHKSLHPALVPLLLKIAAKVHRDGDVLAANGEFPSPKYTDIPLSEDAERYFRTGPPVLQRVLPFWVASLVDRLKIMIIPLMMLMMPLIRLAPPLVRWQTRRKIYTWYAQLRKIDQMAIHGMSPAEAKVSLDHLHHLEQQIAHVGVPLSYMEEYYNLRMHLNLVRSRVNAIHDADVSSHGAPVRWEGGGE